ncbi:hypothetical protein PGTUg99_003141, partial [Puccinia graminis f. sp. tritici]
TSNWSDPLTITSWQSSRLFATSSSPEPTPRTSRGNSLISPRLPTHRSWQSLLLFA